MEEALPEPILVTTDEELLSLVEQWAAMPALAIDTEADSLYSYYEKVCLVQVSVPGADYIIDPLSGLDIRPLGALFADAAIECVFHAAEYDILSLKRDYGFTFANIFDTMIASRVLGYPKVGLANMLQEHFGVTLDKRFQRADWGQRPLTEELLSYARMDTHYLLRLRDQLKAQLLVKNRLEEAQEEFARLARVEPHERIFDPDGFWRIDGTRHLPPAGLAVLRELYRWREEQAAVQDRPPFKVMSDQQMMALAEAQPTSRSELTHVRQLGPYQREHYSNAILAAVHRGLQASPPRPPRRNHTRPDEAVEARYEQLRAWRRTRAAERGVEPDVIVSNEALRAIATLAPTDLADLEAIRALGPWKRQTYGAEIVHVLQNFAAEQKPQSQQPTSAG